MSQQQYIQILQAELSRLNQEIDRKIINGELYMREARRHKEVLRKIKQHASSSGFMSKVRATFKSLFIYA